MSRWISGKDKNPTCKTGADALGTPVLIWPRRETDGLAYYGRRATGRLAFYLYGAEIFGVTHWQSLPGGPESAQKAKKL